MKKFLTSLNSLIQSNKPLDAINLMLNEISDFQKLFKDKAFEVDEIKNQLYVISSVLNDLKSKSISNTLDLDSYYLYRSKQIFSILEIKNSIENHIEFAKYLKNKELAEIEKVVFKTNKSEQDNNSIPKPILYLSESSEKRNLEELSSVLTVATITNLGEAIDQTTNLIVAEPVLKKVIDNSDAINQLLIQENIDKIPRFNNSNEIVSSIKNYNESITKIIKSIEECPENINILQRAVMPHFYIVNEGDVSLVNPLINIFENKNVKFVEKNELSKIDISLPNSHPEYIKKILEFAKNLEYFLSSGFKKEMKPDSKTSIRQHHGYGDNIMRDKIIYNYHQEKGYLKKYEIRKFDNELRIDFNGSIKRGFFSTVENENFYLIPYLNKGEETFLEYKCFLDNHESFCSGRIKIIGI